MLKFKTSIFLPTVVCIIATAVYLLTDITPTKQIQAWFKSFKNRATVSTLTITKGGTYRGYWQSDNPNVPAVLIQTSEPVIIANSKLRGPGDLIRAPYTTNHVKLTVLNTYGYGSNTNLDKQGRFLAVDLADKVVVKHCYIESTAGMYVHGYTGDGSVNQSMQFLYNRARNIQGHKSFVQLQEVRHVPGIEIAWNQVINEPYNSRVEDNINMFLSSGTSSSPIRIHDNYIQGAYPANPAKDSYSGSGIMVSDGASPTVADAVQFVRAFNNQVVGIGMAIAAGHDNQFYNNRIVSDGHLDDGTIFHASNVGAYIWDLYGDKAKGRFYNNYAHDNTIGYLKANGTRSDSWFPDCASGKCINNTALPNPITSNTEKAEFQAWQNKVASHKVAIGPKF